MVCDVVVVHIGCGFILVLFLVLIFFFLVFGEKYEYDDLSRFMCILEVKKKNVKFNHGWILIVLK